MSVYSSLGKKIAEYALHKRGNSWQANLILDRIPAGMYFIILQDSNKKIMKSFLKE